MKVEEFTEDQQPLVWAELPGVDPGKDVDFSIPNEKLCIRSEPRHEEKAVERDYRRSEIPRVVAPGAAAAGTDQRDRPHRQLPRRDPGAGTAGRGGQALQDPHQPELTGMASRDALQAYRRKRDFRSTSEPRGSAGRRRPAEPRFVVQKHAARSLHYDFRLEAAGVLKSWAVPKGPSTNPSEKVMATPTEDHPLDYATFEGVIPEGQYGAGPVIVWDAGTYSNQTERDGIELPVAEAIDAGHVSVWLEGEKLRGGYALTRIRSGKAEAWLLVKKRDEAADARRNPRSSRPESVVSGRRVEEVAAEAG